MPHAKGRQSFSSPASLRIRWILWCFRKANLVNVCIPPIADVREIRSTAIFAYKRSRIVLISVAAGGCLQSMSELSPILCGSARV